MDRAGNQGKTPTAKDAKYSFGRLIHPARAEPVTVAKHGRPVAVVMVVEDFERLKALHALAARMDEKSAGKKPDDDC